MYFVDFFVRQSPFEASIDNSVTEAFPPAGRMHKFIYQPNVFGQIARGISDNLHDIVFMECGGLACWRAHFPRITSHRTSHRTGLGNRRGSRRSCANPECHVLVTLWIFAESFVPADLAFFELAEKPVILRPEQSDVWYTK